METRYLPSSRSRQLMATEGAIRVRESQRRRIERRLSESADASFPIGLVGWGVATGGSVLAAAYLFVLPLIVELLRLLSQ